MKGIMSFDELITTVDLHDSMSIPPLGFIANKQNKANT